MTTTQLNNIERALFCAANYRSDYNTFPKEMRITLQPTKVLVEKAAEILTSNSSEAGGMVDLTTLTNYITTRKLNIETTVWNYGTPYFLEF